MATFPILRADPKTLPRRRSQPNQTNLTLFPSAARHGTCESPGIASAPTQVSDPRTKPATELVGIARLAASSPCADAKRRTEYFLLPVRSILNHCDSDRVPFAWTVNPYRGCEFGCKYCYARYTHEYMDLDGSDFETKIYVKQNAGLSPNATSRARKSGANTSPSAPQPILTSRQSANSAPPAPSSKKWPGAKG